MHAEPPGLAQPHLAEAAAQPVSARDGQLYGVDGQPLTIKGVNWFGFETSVTAVHGLWQVSPLSCAPPLPHQLPGVARDFACMQTWEVAACTTLCMHSDCHK